MGEWQRSSTSPPPPSAPIVFLQVGVGVVLVFTCHAIALASAAAVFGLSYELNGMRDLQDALVMLAGTTVLGLSCVQAAYVVPLGVATFFVRRPIALGVVIGAALTFLLQGACYGAFCLPALA